MQAASNEADLSSVNVPVVDSSGRVRLASSWKWKYLPPLFAFIALRVMVTVASPKWVRPWSFSSTKGLLLQEYTLHSSSTG